MRKPQFSRLYQMPDVIRWSEYPISSM